MPEAAKMKCPACGALMNHHADKIDYGAAVDEGADAEAGGVIIEAHTCPVCGCSASRTADVGEVFGE